MTERALTYAAVTPARNEAENLRRLAACLVDQTLKPTVWIVIDDESTDDTRTVIQELGREHPWIRLQPTTSRGRSEKGTATDPATAILRGHEIRAFHAGLDALAEVPDVVVKLDADVSMAREYFERLVGAFASNPRLGIASGNCLEFERGFWRPQHVTAGHVRGATRAYRRECLAELLPLEERIGWDGLDELKASVRGWATRTVDDLSFYHHRRVGERDGGRHRRWYAQGRGSHYMGYRFSYLLLRALHHARRDPPALAMIWGFAAAALAREPQYGDPQARAQLRHHQRLRELPRRRREALGSPE